MKGTFKKGFTLLEMLITLAVIAISLMIAIPGFHSIIFKTRTEINVRRLMSTLKFARSQAILKGENVTVCPRSNLTTCGSNWNNGIKVFTDSQILQTIDSFHHCQIQWNRPQNQITFLPTGALQGQNGSLLYEDNSEEKAYQHRIAISQTGRIRMVPTLS